MLAANGWRYEGIAFRAVKTGGVQVKRYYLPGGKHMLTTNKIEQDALANSGWRYEGVAFLAPEDSDGTNDVYRLYNPYNGDHLFTASSKEKNVISAHGWRYEGVGYQSLR